MRSFKLLALVGMAAMAMAKNETYSWSRPNTRPSPTKAPQQLDRHQKPNGKPRYMGCFESDGFPSFSLAGVSNDMTVELCAASCPSQLLGLYNT